jgi:hypothetical protein
VVEVEGKIHDTRISILIDPGATLSYITPDVVESNKLKKQKHEKSWLVQLATCTKRKVVNFIYDLEFSLDGQKIRTNLNILPLGSYDMIIGMDWLEQHKAVLDCYTKVLSYKDNLGTARTTQGIPKPVSVRQVLAMQLKKCIRKGSQVYGVESQNGPYFHSINSLKPSQLLPFHLHITSTSLHLPHYWVKTMLFQSLSILNIFK